MFISFTSFLVRLNVSGGISFFFSTDIHFSMPLDLYCQNKIITPAECIINIVNA